MISVGRHDFLKNLLFEVNIFKNFNNIKLNFVCLENTRRANLNWNFC